MPESRQRFHKSCRFRRLFRVKVREMLRFPALRTRPEMGLARPYLKTLAKKDPIREKSPFFFFFSGFGGSGVAADATAFPDGA